ncbi:MAG: HAMP domain-containing protein [Dehalococcoidia bacterium]|nr:HAMP domain-containing protein [Dehalococcoidia bacterium]
MPVAIVGSTGPAVSSEPGWAPAPGSVPITDMQPHALRLAGRDHVASAFALTDADGQPVGSLVTGRDRTQLNAERAAAQRQVGVAVGVALAAGAVLALLLNTLTLRPLRELARAVRRIRGGDLLSPVPRSGPAELRAVGAALDDMRVGVHAAREQLLAANASLSAQATASAAGLTAATDELAVMHAIVAAIARDPAAGARVAVDQLLRLEWVDGAFVALAGADGRLTARSEAALGAARAGQLVATL